MKKLKSICTMLLALLVSSCSSDSVQLNELPYNKGINVTPRPLSLVEKTGKFVLSSDVVFVADNADLQKVVDFFATKMQKSTGYNFKITQTAPSKKYIQLSLNPSLDLNNEGYTLNADENSIEIVAKTPQGAFYGMQTLLQLLPAQIESPTLVDASEWSLPAVEIKDEPRLHYRGMMLDVCRHFLDVDFIKKQLDVLAMFKINTFHWHLTEDQAWRIEIKKYPKLTEISAKRTEGEGDTYGPYFYTQEQIKEVVAYAKERFIEVIPEIELPGHGVAALTAYPQFSCTGGPFEVRNVWGISNDIYCAGNEETFQFLEDVIAEVVPLFESEYFHIGGDEAPKARWKECPKCQARIKAEGLKAEKGHTAEEKLQSYFVQRIEKVLLSHGKKMIGWDEILEGGLAPSATVMSWRGEQGGITAGNMGHDVIMTPSPWFYLDAFQADPNVLPVGIGSYIELNKTYSYNPIPEKLDADKHHHILGVQGNIWAEYMYTPELREFYIYPRILAVAEVGWTAAKNKDYPDFERRLENERVRLDMHGINYHIPIPQDKNNPSANFVAFTDNTTLEFMTIEPTTIVYTTDGTEPNANSTVYTSALTFDQNTTLKLRSILSSGKMSDVRTIIIEKQDFSPAIEKNAESKGLKADYFKGVAHKVSELDGLTPTETEYIVSPQRGAHLIPNYREVFEEDYYSSIFTGTITVDADDVYFFKSNADQVWIDGKLIVDNEGMVKKNSRKDGSIALAKGAHDIKIVRVSGIIGGWPPLWESVYLRLRAAGEPKYKTADDSYFK